MKMMPSTVVDRASRRPLRRLGLRGIFLGAAMFLGAENAAFASAPATSEDTSLVAPAGATSAERPSSKATAPHADAKGQSYAAREAQSKGLEKFKGGDVVIVGSTTVIIVLLVVLLIILL
jgi:hypothetical protein